MPYYPHATEIGAIYTLWSPETGAFAVLNDPSDSNYVGMLSEVSGLDNPEVRESAEDLVESNGGVHGRFYYGRRPITLGGAVFGHASVAERTTRLDKLRRATQAMRSDGYMTWKPSTRVENLTSNPTFVTPPITPVDAFINWVNVNSGGTAPTRTQGTGFGGVALLEGTSTAHQSSYPASASGQTNTVRAVPKTYDLAHTTETPGSLDGQLATSYVRGRAAFRVLSASAGGSPTVRLEAHVYNAAKTYLGAVTLASSTMAPGAGNWNILTGAVTVNSILATYPTAAFVQVGGTLQSVAAATYVWNMTNVSFSLDASSTVPAHLDGYKAGGYWWGLANDSPSASYVPMLVSFRRQQPFRESGGWVKNFQVQIVSADPYIMNPWSRPTLVALSGGAYPVTNQGNATHFPVVELRGTFNAGTYVDANGGRVYEKNAQTTAGLVGTLDTLRHVRRNAAGALFNSQIDWALTTVWPSTPPGGGDWQLVNGASGANTSGSAIVISRDVWV